MSWCKHYNGISNGPCCKAGINYDSVKSPESGASLLARYPCFLGSTQTCIKRIFPTAEELAAEEASYKAYSEGITMARAMIIATKQSKGSIRCPHCNAGDLHFSVASFNGHVRAKCTTDRCLNWME